MILSFQLQYIFGVSGFQKNPTPYQQQIDEKSTSKEDEGNKKISGKYFVLILRRDLLN